MPIPCINVFILSNTVFGGSGESINFPLFVGFYWFVHYDYNLRAVSGKFYQPENFFEINHFDWSFLNSANQIVFPLNQPENSKTNIPNE